MEEEEEKEKEATMSAMEEMEVEEGKEATSSSPSKVYWVESMVMLRCHQLSEREVGQEEEWE